MPVPNYWVRTDVSYAEAEVNENVGEMAVLDIDGDGDLDFITASFRYPLEDRGVPIRIMLNNGAGVFSDGTATFFPGGAPLTTHPRDMVIADFNGDGRDDLFIADHGLDATPVPGAQNRLFLSNGVSGFIDATSNLPQLDDFSHSAAAGDIDGDDDIDLLVMNISGGTPPGGPLTAPYFLINDGSGNFARVDNFLPTDVVNRTAERIATTCLLFDADGDGDLDLFFGTNGTAASSSIFINGGDGDFSSAVEITMPIGPFNPATVLDADSIDLNNDGALDLVVTMTLGYTNTYVQILINDGAGHFTDETSSRYSQAPDLGTALYYTHLVDMNGDGFLDLFFQSATVQPIALNDGAGHFVLLPDSLLDYGGWGSPQFTGKLPIDANGDGRLDILVDYGSGPGTENFWLFTQQDMGFIHTGDAAANALLGDESTETLSGLGGDDVIFGAQGGDTLNGDDGADYLNGGAGSDTLNGGLGVDVMVGGDGADQLNGGDGSDTAVYSSSAAGLTVDLVTPASNTGDAAGDTFASIENLSGSSFNDTLRGDGGANVLSGGTGVDILEGRAGADTLNGGDGDDQLNGGVGGDTIDGGAGFDTVRYDGAAAGVIIYVDAPHANTGEAAGDTLTSIEGFVGSTFNDYMVGGVANNLLQGFGGTDILEGHEGDDLLDGGDGDDALQGGLGGDILDGGAGFDSARYDGAVAGVTIYVDAAYANQGEAAGDFHISIEGIVGSTFNDYLVGGVANNILQGFSGHDILEGHGGDDLLDGGDGNDQMNGGTGGDIFDGGAGFDTVRYDGATAGVIAFMTDAWANTGEAAGDAYISIEALYGSNFNDTLAGASNANELQGFDGIDFIFGYAGNDFLGGGNGGDFLDGGAGADQLQGGAGDDQFVFRAGESNSDAVFDFAGNGAAAGDNFLFIGYGTPAGGATFTQLDATHWQITSADGLITDIITLTNGASVDASDFGWGS